jgi:uncharacterized damage-inducible protein DinB
MSTLVQVPWLERQFRFDLPVSHYPAVVERVRGTPSRVEDRLLGLPETILTKRLGGRWSIQENVGHLVDMELLWIRRANELLSGADRLTPADMSNFATERAGYNSYALEELLATLRERRAHLVELLEVTDEEEVKRSAWHDRLRVRLRLIDHAVFIAEHDDHHLVRVAELLRRPRP